MPCSTTPGITVSRTFLFGSSTDGASHRSVRSWSCPSATRAPKSRNFSPELLTNSGGLPEAKRGCSTVETAWVDWWMIFAFGNAAWYSFWCTSVAYLSP
jgi:hypothetical protein